MAKMDLTLIPADNVLDVWPLISKLVDTGIKMSNRRYTVPAIQKLAIKGYWQTWVAWDIEEKIIKAVMFTEVYNELSGLKMGNIRFLSGEDRKDWLELLPSLEDEMKSIGVQKLEVWARRGWQKDLPDYSLTHILLEKDLDDGHSRNSDPNRSRKQQRAAESKQEHVSD